MRAFRRGGLYFTKHAAQAMADRGIRWRDAQNALRNQLNEHAGTHDLEGTVVIEGPGMDGRSLCVVVEEDDPTRVVTVFRN